MFVLLCVCDGCSSVEPKSNILLSGGRKSLLTVKWRWKQWHFIFKDVNCSNSASETFYSSWRRHVVLGSKWKLKCNFIMIWKWKMKLAFDIYLSKTQWTIFKCNSWNSISFTFPCHCATHWAKQRPLSPLQLQLRPYFEDRQKMKLEYVSLLFR